MKWILLIFIPLVSGCSILDVVDPAIARSFDPTIPRGFESSLKTRQLRTEMGMKQAHSDRFYGIDYHTMHARYGHDHWKYLKYWDTKTQRWETYKSYTEYLNR